MAVARPTSSEKAAAAAATMVAMAADAQTPSATTTV